MSRQAVLYGAYELKRSYQSHLGWGIAVGATFHVAAILSILYFVRAGEAPFTPSVPIEPVTDGTSVVGKLREIDWKKVGTTAPASVPVVPELYGVPVAAADESFDLDYTAPARISAVVEGGGAGNSEGPATGMSGGIGGSGISGTGTEPLPGIFVAVESQPVRIRHVAPEFPEMARLTGREGKVVVRALVDRDGTVRRAEIAKPSGTNVGFDEAAVDAALRCLYKPAIQNGMPVMVWVTYAVEFKLK